MRRVFSEENDVLYSGHMLHMLLLFWLPGPENGRGTPEAGELIRPNENSGDNSVIRIRVLESPPPEISDLSRPARLS
jgi:hypothetical protein